MQLPFLNISRARAIAILSTAAVAAMLAASSALQAAPGRQVLTGHRPVDLPASASVGRLPATNRMVLTVGLPWRNPAALTNLLEELYDPASPRYHQWLSTEEFTRQFGPTEEDYQAVAAYLQAQGLRVTATYSSRVLLGVSGTVAEVENAFHVNLLQFAHPTESRVFFEPDAEPSLDLAAPVLHVSGLDNYQLPRPASLVKRAPLPQPPAREDGSPMPMAGSGPGGSYRGPDFRAAYASGVGLTGSGQYVGLLQFDGYYASDITTYASLTGLTNLPLQNVLLDEATGNPGGNNIEVALDIEMALSMAPGLSGVIVYEGQIGNSILARMAADNVAKQLSASWTYGTDATSQQIFQQFGAQGQAYFNASGDSGAYPGTPASPTDSPYITSVGGTTLSTRGPALGWLSEVGWSWFPSQPLASSGGVSTAWAIPTWQQGVSMLANQGSSSKRNIPDVSMVSDNVFVISDNGSQGIVGGDSVASPLWAAFIALVNQQAVANGQPPIGFINPAVYAIGKSTGYSTNFHDIRSGNNTNSASPTKYTAVAGYDLVTGWGTPAGRPLINTLAPPPAAATVTGAGATISLSTCSPTNGTINPEEVVMVSFGLQNVGAANTAAIVATLQTNADVTPLSGPQSYGTLTGGGAAVSRTFYFTAHGSCGGTIAPTLQISNGPAAFTNVTFVLPLGAPAVSMSQNFDGVSAPAVPTGWGRLVTGSGSNWITTTAFRYSAPNSIYVVGTTNAAISDLQTGNLPITSPAARLTFRHSYVTEIEPTNAASAYDGGVLEIRIGTGGTFTDILAAGGSFVTGGYTRTLDATTGSLLGGRQAWAGTSGGFITTTVNLPASAAGQNIQLKWRLATDIGNALGATYWYVDDIALQDGSSCCTPAGNADLAVSQVVFPSPGLVGQSVAYSLAITNLGPGPATHVTLTNVLPDNATYTYSSPGLQHIGNTVVGNMTLLTNGGRTNFTILVTPSAEGWLTNSISLASDYPDLNPANSAAESVIAVYAPPAIAVQPTNQSTVPGGSVSFTVVATGSSPLSYQWTFGGTNLAGATDATLVLTNIQPSQAGDYAVTVSNPYGTAGSAIATLSVVPAEPPSISGLSVTATNVAISLPSVSGVNYTLEYKDLLTDPDWTPVGPAISGTGLILILQDTNFPIAPARFYRIRSN